jgi:hypothetical protein
MLTIFGWCWEKSKLRESKWRVASGEKTELGAATSSETGDQTRGSKRDSSQKARWKTVLRVEDFRSE